jgi:hypothetical protein
MGTNERRELTDAKVLEAEAKHADGEGEGQGGRPGYRTMPTESKPSALKSPAIALSPGLA